MQSCRAKADEFNSILMWQARLGPKVCRRLLTVMLVVNTRTHCACWEGPEKTCEAHHCSGLMQDMSTLQQKVAAYGAAARLAALEM